MPGTEKPGRFTLVPGQWFALTMFPGYGDCPYHSPIRVDSIAPIPDRCFEVEYLNLGYAAGVQGMRKRWRTVRRVESHIIAEEASGGERSYVITKFNSSWFVRHFENLNASDFFDSTGEPIERALLGLAKTAW